MLSITFSSSDAGFAMIVCLQWNLFLLYLIGSLKARLKTKTVALTTRTNSTNPITQITTLGLRRQRRRALATSVQAPMVGKILKVEKAIGERVEEDDVVLVMEAMKMEIPIVAPVSGVLKELKVSAGQAVEAEQELAVIE